MHNLGKHDLSFSKQNLSFNRNNVKTSHILFSQLFCLPIEV